MKRIIFILFAALIFNACTTQEELRTTDLSVPEIVGKWKLTEYYVSPGGITTWQTAEDGYEYTFSLKGDFFSTQEGTCNGKYNLEGDRLIITPDCSDEEAYTMIINSIDEKNFEMRYEGCIEGCIYRFKKIK